MKEFKREYITNSAKLIFDIIHRTSNFPNERLFSPYDSTPYQLNNDGLPCGDRQS